MSHMSDNCVILFTLIATYWTIYPGFSGKILLFGCMNPGRFGPGSFRPNFGVGRFGLGRWVDSALGRFGRSLYQNVDCLG